MDDSGVWAFEESLWTGDAEHYRTLVDAKCVMVLPAAPFVFTCEQAVSAVASTPRWSSASFSEKHVMRPHDGLIAIAYKVEAKREGTATFVAYCTTTMHRLDHNVWCVIQHQQSSQNPLKASD